MGVTQRRYWGRASVTANPEGTDFEPTGHFDKGVSIARFHHLWTASGPSFSFRDMGDGSN